MIQKSSFPIIFNDYFIAQDVDYEIGIRHLVFDDDLEVDYFDDLTLNGFHLFAPPYTVELSSKAKNDRIFYGIAFSVRDSMLSLKIRYDKYLPLAWPQAYMNQDMIDAKMIPFFKDLGGSYYCVCADYFDGNEKTIFCISNQISSLKGGMENNRIVQADKIEMSIEEFYDRLALDSLGIQEVEDLPDSIFYI
jgi:hypothetical protein